MEHMVLTFILAAIVGFAVFMYVLLDGFDLGVAILFPFVKSESDRDIMMASILPVWDGNETWLVLGGATLYGAFPIAYSTLLPTLYLPLFMMLIALIFRGVAFEFRHSANRSRILWNTGFALGSAIAAFCQGVVLGTFVKGYSTNGVLDITTYKWFSPFAVMTGIAVVFGYALLGSCWLIRKTEGQLQQSMYRWAKHLLWIVAAFMIIVSIWTPFVDNDILSRWLSFPRMLYVSPLPILTAIAAVILWRSLQRKNNEMLPFILTMLLFLFCYVGFAYSVWPFIIPHAVTLWQAAAPVDVQTFILVGLVIVLPVIVGYTIYSYRVFRGKVSAHGVHY